MDKDGHNEIENLERDRIDERERERENEKGWMREKEKKVFDLVGKIKLQIFDPLFIFRWRIKSFFQSTIFHSPKQFSTLSFFLSSITQELT